jgi:hypothetical protein
MNGGISALLAVADAPVESPQEISCLSCRFSTGSITMKKKSCLSCLDSIGCTRIWLNFRC